MVFIRFSQPRSSYLSPHRGSGLDTIIEWNVNVELMRENVSSCSPPRQSPVLQSTPCKHPVIVLQDVAFSDLHALVEFIYHGEVNVHQRSLSSFLKTAEVLRVSGLTQQADQTDRDEVSRLSLTRRLPRKPFCPLPDSPGDSTREKILEERLEASRVL